jgi:hypothetical protein
MSKLEQVQTINTDNDIKHLLDAAYVILHNPIAMFDTNYSLIAYADAETDDPLWNELISTGSFTMETQKFFAEELFTYYVSNADKMVVMKSDALQYERTAAYVFNRNHIKVAILIMVASDAPFEEDGLLAFGALADKITEKIRDDEHYTAFGWSYHDAIIVRILDGEIKDTQVYAPHVQILYDGFETYSYLHAAVADVQRGDLQNRRLEHVRDLLRKRYPSFKFAIYSNSIVMIMGSNQNIFNSRRVLGAYDRFFAQNKIFAGVSSSFENFYELRKYYDEAVFALKSGVENTGNRQVHLFESD